jgi:endonuclease YncB( thermonuclease family)
MENVKLLLSSKKTKDVLLFSLNGLCTIGKVVEVYDGDTCKIILHYNNDFYKFNCRLHGLDTPEMKPLLSKVDRETEISKAYKCRNKLIQLCTNCVCDINSMEKKTNKILETNSKIIYVKCFEFDKYGRLLVELYENETGLYNDAPPGCSFNKILIDEGFAVPYDGGTKKLST